MQTSEQILISLKLKDELLVSCSHVFHLLIDHLLHLDHLLFVLGGHVVEVVMEHLQCLTESFDLRSDFISQIADASDILEDLVLLVFEVLVQALDVSEGILDFHVDLGHAFCELTVFGLDLPDSHVHELG